MIQLILNMETIFIYKRHFLRLRLNRDSPCHHPWRSTDP